MSGDSTVRLGLDASGAKRGAAQYTAAIERIITSTRSLSKAMDSAQSSKKSPFTQIARDLAKLNAVKVSASLPKRILAISNALKTLRGPSAKAIKNTSSFLRVMSRAKINASVIKNVTGMSKAMATYKGPTAGAVKNTLSFFSAMTKAKISPSLGKNLQDVSSALSGFKAPSAAAVKNIRELGSALRTIKVPRGIGAINSAMMRVSPAFRQSASSTKQFSGALQGVPWRRASAGAKNLTGNMRGLNNVMSLSYQAGSQLRVLFGALTVGSFATSMYDATLGAQRFITTMGVTSESTEEAASTMKRFGTIVDTFGIDIVAARNEFGKFSTAARLTGASTEDVLFIFEQFSGAMRVMGLGAGEQSRTYNALAQMFSKGKISSEELRRQLEQIPGVFALAEQAVREATGDPSVRLDDLLKAGAVTTDMIVLLADKLKQKYGPQMEEAINRADASVGRLKNSWVEFLTIVGQSGAFDAFGNAATDLNEIVKSDSFTELAQKIGGTLTVAIDKGSQAIGYLLTNLSAIMKVAKPVLAVFAAKQFAGFIAGALSATVKLGAFILAMNPLTAAVTAGTAALAIYWNESVKVGETSATVGEITAAVWRDLLGWVKRVTPVVLQAFKSFIDGAVGWLSAMNDGLVTNGQKVQQWGNTFIAIIDVVGRSITLVIGSAFNSVIGTAKVLLGALGDIARLDFSKAGQTLQQGLADGFKGAASFLDEANSIMDDGANKDYLGSMGIDFSGMAEGFKNYTDHIEESIIKNRELANAVEERERREYIPGDLPDNPDRNVLNTDESLQGLNALGQSAKSVAEAMKVFEEQQASLDSRLASGAITLSQYTDALEYHKGKLEETVDPYAAMVRSMQEEINLQRMAASERSGVEAFLQRKNQLLEKGVILTEEQTAELKNLIAMQQQLSNSPMQSWVDGIEEFGVAVEEVGVKAMGTLTDSLADLIVDGKADWASMFKGILKDLIKLALNQVWKTLFSQNQPQIEIAAPMTGAAGSAVDLTGTSNPSVMAGAVAQGIAMSGGLLGNDISQGAGPFSQMENFLSGGTSNSSGVGSFPSFDEIQKMGGGAANMSPAGNNRPSFLFMQDMMSAGNLSSDGPNMSPAGNNKPSFLFMQDMMEAGTGSSALPSGITDAMESAVSGFTQEVNQIGSQLSSLGESFRVLEGLGDGGSPMPSLGGINDTQLQSLLSGSQAPMPREMSDSLASMRQMTSQASNFMQSSGGSTLNISSQDADLMARVLGTEWARSGGEGQAGAILDTMMNRAATPGNEYGQAGGMAGVLNKRWQFSAINAPLEGAYGTAANAPLQADANAFTQRYLQQRAGGLASSVGTNTHYLNPAYSSQNSLNQWGNDVVGQANASGQVFGQGDSQHFHGTAQGSSNPESFNVGYGGQSAGQQMIDSTTTQGIGGMGLPGGMGLGGGMQGEGMEGMSGLGDSFTQEMEGAFTRTSQAFPEAMTPGMDKAAQILPQKLTEDEGLGDSMTSAMQPANQQSAQDFQQQYTNANTQIAQDFASKMQNSGGGGMGGGMGGGGGGMGGFGSILGMIGGMFKTGGIVGGTGAKGTIPLASLKGARSMKFGGIVGDPDAEPIIAHKGELVTPANEVAAMRRVGKNAAMLENKSVDAHTSSMARTAPFGPDGSGSAGGYGGSTQSTSTNTINMVINTPDADSFQASQGQIAADMGNAQARAARRNH